MTKHATALRAFNDAGGSFAKGEVILGMDVGQFTDWSADGVDLVREATAAEVAKAKGEAKPARKAAAKPKTRRRPMRPSPEPAAPVAAEPEADDAPVDTAE